MGWGENIWAFLAAFAGWTFSRFTEPRRVESANVFSGLGIPALSFSTVSHDDGLQQEQNCPATSSVRLSVRTRVAPRDTHFRAPIPTHSPHSLHLTFDLRES